MGDLLNQLGINSSFLLQFVVFILAYGVLSRFLFKPYLKILEQREKRTLGGQTEVKSLLEEEEKVYRTYKNKLQDLQQQISAFFQKAEHSAKQNCEEKLQTAHKKRQQQLADLQEKLKKQLGEEETKTEEEAQKLTAIITSKLIE